MSLLERYKGPGGERHIQDSLGHHRLFQGDRELITFFIGNSEVVGYLPGETLIQRGNSDRHILFILAGKVEIDVNGDTSKTRGAGDHVGEMALLDSTSLRSATVRAVDETVVLKVDEPTFSHWADGSKGFLWKHIAIELSNRLRQRLADVKPTHRVVLLIHGIRTRAEWQEMVKEALTSDFTKVIPIKYGLFDLFRFWCPLFTRGFPIRRTEQKVCQAILDHPSHEVVVIAHSFGTHAIADILRRNILVKINKLILCGGIVADSFNWGKLLNRPGMILNDCGHADLCPRFASSVTWGYGASGVHGFGVVEVNDRFFNFGHSDFFKKEFVDRYWKPFVESGLIVKSDYPPTTKGWLLTNLASLPFQWLLLGGAEVDPEIRASSEVMSLWWLRVGSANPDTPKPSESQT